MLRLCSSAKFTLANLCRMCFCYRKIAFGSFSACPNYAQMGHSVPVPDMPKWVTRCLSQLCPNGILGACPRYSQKGYSVPVPDMPKWVTQCLSQICPNGILCTCPNYAQMITFPFCPIDKLPFSV